MQSVSSNAVARGGRYLQGVEVTTNETWLSGNPIKRKVYRYPNVSFNGAGVVLQNNFDIDPMRIMKMEGFFYGNVVQIFGGIFFYTAHGNLYAYHTVITDTGLVVVVVYYI